MAAGFSHFAVVVGQESKDERDAFGTLVLPNCGEEPNLAELFQTYAIPPLHTHPACLLKPPSAAMIRMACAA